ncbi:MAG: 50S ribosomal protein L25 [Fretibacterium sp.]|nr:50S ribosomal protein L25 [Fretibacterium sp.]
MSELVTIVMEPREKGNRRDNRRLRQEGFIPCVFYGPELPEAISGKLKKHQLERIISMGHWETTRLTVKLPSGGEEMCLIRELQRHPLTGHILHIDLLRLIKGRKITVRIPVQIQGREESPGIKDGGVLDHVHDIEIETVPMSIPEAIVIDISKLNLGDTVYLRDIALGEDVELITDPDEVAAVIMIPRTAEEAEPEEEEDQEVEVLAKGKAAKDEEDEEA